jgi:hypothetical protein
VGDRYKLSGDWGLRQLVVDPQRPSWAIQFKGMDWIKVSDFLPPAQNGRSTLDEDMRAFAEAIGGVPVSD